MLIGLKKAYSTFPLKDKISLEVFDKEVKSILRIVRNEMVDGEKIKTPLGTFSILERKRSFHSPSVNIVDSMEERNRIIAEGGTPYEAYKDEKGRIIGNNGGEKYFVYFTDDTFFTINLGNKRMVYVNDSNYKFTPAASTERLRRKRLKEDSLIHLKYAED